MRLAGHTPMCCAVEGRPVLGREECSLPVCHSSPCHAVALLMDLIVCMQVDIVPREDIKEGEAGKEGGGGPGGPGGAPGGPSGSGAAPQQPPMPMGMPPRPPGEH